MNLKSRLQNEVFFEVATPFKFSDITREHDYQKYLISIMLNRWRKRALFLCSLIWCCRFFGLRNLFHTLEAWKFGQVLVLFARLAMDILVTYFSFCSYNQSTAVLAGHLGVWVSRVLTVSYILQEAGAVQHFTNLALSQVMLIGRGVFCTLTFEEYSLSVLLSLLVRPVSLLLYSSACPLDPSGPCLAEEMWPILVQRTLLVSASSCLVYWAHVDLRRDWVFQQRWSAAETAATFSRSASSPLCDPGGQNDDCRIIQ